MRIDVYHHLVEEPGTSASLKRIERLLHQVITKEDAQMATAAETNEKLDALGTALDEIQGDITELQEAASSREDVPADIAEKIAALGTKATEIAGMVPEPVTEPTEPEA